MAERKTKKEPAKKVVATKKKTSPKKAAAKAQPKTKARIRTKSKAAPAKAAPKKPLQKKTADTTRKRKTATKTPALKKLSDKRSEEERRLALRRSLVAMREQIVREAKSEISKYIKGETRQLVDTALDDGDWSVVDLSEDISLRQLSAHRDTLRKTDEALRKLDEGTYGICEDCGEAISEKRLKILPFAIYCTDCQERREEMEEMERREG